MATVLITNFLIRYLIALNNRLPYNVFKLFVIQQVSRLKFITLFSFIWLFYAPNVLSNAVIKLGVENSWPPYSDSSGNGISKDTVEKAFNAMGVDVQFSVLPYARALKMTKLGTLDGAFNVTKQASTIKKYNFHQEPILLAKASFYYPANSVLNYKSIDDVPRGTSIALIIDYEYSDKYQRNMDKFDEVRVSKQKQIIQLLIKDRVDMAIMFDEVADYTLDKMQLSNTAIKKGATNHVSEIYVAFSKAKDTSEIIKTFDQGLIKIRSRKAAVISK